MTATKIVLEADDPVNFRLGKINGLVHERNRIFRAHKVVTISTFRCARGGGRTHTRREPRGILSPLRMPFRHPGTAIARLSHRGTCCKIGTSTYSFPRLGEGGGLDWLLRRNAELLHAANVCRYVLEARGGIEPPIRVLQTLAFPLGDCASLKLLTPNLGGTHSHATR